MRRTILLTGATGGIGLCLARILLAEGHRCYFLGRKPLQEVGGHDSIFCEQNYLQVNLSDPDVVGAFWDAWNQRSDRAPLDLVIHNAGLGYLGKLEAQAESSIKELVKVNFTAPVLLTQALLPYLMEREGKIAFVSSVMTSLPTPHFAVYTATKAALEGFARSLRVEMNGRVEVQVIRPGGTRTGMHRKVGTPLEKTKRFAAPEDVAAQFYAALMNGKSKVTLGRANRALSFFAPVLSALSGRRHKRRRQPVERRAHALVTGAADGIGRALAREYCARGYRVTGVDIDQVKGADLKAELGENFDFVHQDLLDFNDRWLDQLLPVDLLIHNAGINSTGPLEMLPPKDQERVVGLNFLTPLLLTALLKQRQLLHEGSQIVMLSSLSHFVSYPGASTYAGTKDGLAHFGKSMRKEHAVLNVFPGPAKTAHARRYSPDNSKESSRMEPDRLAGLIANSQQSGNRTLLPGVMAKSVALTGILWPNLVERLMRKAIYLRFPRGNKKFNNLSST